MRRIVIGLLFSLVVVAAAAPALACDPATGEGCSPAEKFQQGDLVGAMTAAAEAEVPGALDGFPVIDPNGVRSTAAEAEAFASNPGSYIDQGIATLPGANDAYGQVLATRIKQSWEETREWVSETVSSVWSY